MSILVLSCSDKSRTASEKVVPDEPLAAENTATAPEAPTHKTEFAVGDKVVLLPISVMEISAIGTRRELSPKDSVGVDLDLTGTLATGETPMAVVEPNNELVYGLRFLGDEKNFMLLSTSQAKEEGLRRASSASDVADFLRLLTEAEAAASKSPAPDALMSLVFDAGNDLAKLARLYPHVRRAVGDEGLHERSRRMLEAFLVDEISNAKAVSTDEARRLLQGTAP